MLNVSFEGGGQGISFAPKIYFQCAHDWVVLSLEVVTVRGLSESPILSTINGIERSMGEHLRNDEECSFASCNEFGSSFSNFFFVGVAVTVAFRIRIDFFLMAARVVLWHLLCLLFPVWGFWSLGLLGFFAPQF